MPTTTDSVERAVNDDVFLQDALGRGIVNLRALARWLNKHRNVEGTLDAIVTALRRYEPPTGADLWGPARAALVGARVMARDDVAVVVTHRTAAACGKLAGLFEAVDVAAGDTLRMVPGQRHVTLAVDEGVLPAVKKALGAAAIKEVFQGLGELTVVPDPGALETPGVLAHIAVALAGRGINVRYCASASPDLYIVVDKEDTVAAHEALRHLTDATPGA